MRLTPLPWIEDDGGRASAGFRGETGDCVTRAIAIATGLSYRDVYDALAELGLAYGARERSARNGVKPAVYRDYFTRHLGWRWTPTMGIGSGCRVHLSVETFPDVERAVVRLSKHLTAVVGGVVRDTHDPTRDGLRCVYGYFSKAPDG